MEKNPNDTKVVKFVNKTDFGFTPEMGCMYDSNPISGSQGGPGINAGEVMVLPYHIGKQLALNLAKVAINRTAPAVDPAGIPTGVPLWDTARLEALQNSYIEEMYTEQAPITMTETEKLMAKVEEYRKMTEQLLQKGQGEAVTTTPQVTEPNIPLTGNEPVVYQDKQEVLAELEKRGIKHDKRSTKETLEKLLA